LIDPAASGACTGCVRAERDGDLLGADYALVERMPLPLPRQAAGAQDGAFDHLRQRWQDLFGASFEVLLYDLPAPI